MTLILPTLSLLLLSQECFFSLLEDIFPSINPVRQFDDELAELTATACDEIGLWADPYFSLKVMQLDEMLDIRHSVFIMGPPGAGKSKNF